MRDPYHLIGRVFRDRYKLTAYAGGGGMGAVYASVDVTSQVIVAVKILKPDILVMHPEFAGLFSREVKAAQELSHPNIVKVLDSGTTDDGLSFMVMEWLEGQTLEQLIATTTLSIPRVQSIFAQMCSAVEAAHARRIIHLDLKPANVFILGDPTNGDHAKVIDFGMARILRSESGTTVTRFLGTYQYCSPEHFGGKVSHRSDVYSLGVTLFQMLVGTLPFGASYVHAKMNPGLELPPIPSVHRARPEVPSAVDYTIRKALQKNPRERYSSVTEFLSAFDKAVAGFSSRGGFFAVNKLRDLIIDRRKRLVMICVGLMILVASSIGIYSGFIRNRSLGNSNSQLVQPPLSTAQSNNTSANLDPTPSASAAQKRTPNDDVRNATPSKVVTIRLSPVYFLGGRRMQSVGMPVTLVSGSYKRTQVVGSEAALTFKSVPCGGMVTVILSDNSYNGGLFPQKVYQRQIRCETALVDLGDLEVSRQ